MNRLVHHKEFILHGLFLEVRDATGHWREKLPWMVLHCFKRSIARQFKCITQKSSSFTEQNYKEIWAENLSKKKMHWHIPDPVKGKNYRGGRGQWGHWASVDKWNVTWREGKPPGRDTALAWCTHWTCMHVPWLHAWYKCCRNHQQLRACWAATPGSTSWHQIPGHVSLMCSHSPLSTTLPQALPLRYTALLAEVC